MAEDISRLRSLLRPRYEGIRLLAEGGMARVYEAKDQERREPVAIKVFHPHVSSVVAFSRFQREVRISGALQHPNLVPVLDSGRLNGFFFYAMPLVNGESLRSRIDRDAPLSLAETVRILRDVAGGLDHAHAQGFVHRDVKPGNILLSKEGAAVSDFGIARAIERAGGEALTRTGVRVGTPNYMSPEQCLCAPDLDGRSDEYSLGCVAFEMLTGDPPFKGSCRILMAQHTRGRPPALEAIRPDTPASVVEAVRRALAKSPEDRFPTAGEFVEALSATAPARVPDSGPWDNNQERGQAL